MKRILLALVAMMTITITANAMSYEQARREALFLTDKMAYELNLSDEQYDAAYEINLDYLMGVTSVDDVYSTYWTRRNLDLSYILLDWQWSAFRAASYFYRPLYWDGGYWHFGIYARYPRRTFFYFDRPSIYVSYRGGHSWRANGDRSFYHGRQDDFRRGGDNHVGMRDRWNNGNVQNNRGNGRSSSTRVTVGNNRNSAFGTSRGTTKSTNTTTTNRNNNSSSFGTSRSNGSFGTRRTTTTTGTQSNNSFGTTVKSPSSSSTMSRSTGSFGSRRSGSSVGTTRSTSVSTPRSTSVGTSRSGSFGSRSTSVGTRSGGSAPKASGGASSRGSFGGRR